MKISANSLNEALSQRNKFQAQSPADKMINNLNKQKNRLQDEIKKLNGSKDDEMTKKTKKEKLQSQIDDIDKQIAALQLEKLQQASDTPKEVSNNLGSGDTQDGSNQPVGVPLAESTHFITALNKHDSLKTMKKVHTDMLGKAHMAMAQISPNGASAAERNAILAPVREFEGKMNAKANEIQDELKKAAKEISHKQKQKKEEQKVTEEKELEKETEDTKNDNLSLTNNEVSSDTMQTNGNINTANPSDLRSNQQPNQEVSQYKKFSPKTEQGLKEKLDFQV